MDVTYLERPQLSRPLLVSAFRGWSDAADAASTTLEFLEEAWSARPFASIDPEEFFDFQVTRPMVRVTEDLGREIVWPETTFSVARIPGTDRDVVLLRGTEPSMRWRRFTGAVLSVLEQAGVELAVSLGALLADVPHSRPMRVTGSAVDSELAARLGLQPSRYEGPTGIVGVLHDVMRRASIPSVSLWAAIPHYVSDTPSPKATLELVRRFGSLVEVSFDTGELEARADAYTEAVQEAVTGDAKLTAYVGELERAWDADAGAADVSGEAIASELEQYLRNLRRDD